VTPGMRGDVMRRVLVGTVLGLLALLVLPFTLIGLLLLAWSRAAAARRR
jgi:hypothetical protein